ncbi:hypothetical protein [Bacillus sp. SA1-12]|uniref:hypothetical protein n=1 Tax=Bacillus sp. SA1-12 TaxID=1455638 RepID=UPI0012E0579B|nr:hypothetical protein [Bacillus sp. SA1-12]
MIGLFADSKTETSVELTEQEVSSELEEVVETEKTSAAEETVEPTDPVEPPHQ